MMKADVVDNNRNFGCLLASRGFLLLFGVMLQCNFASCQTDTIFWFVAPDIEKDHNDSPIYLRLSAYDNLANVSIIMPANPAFAPIQITLLQGQSNSVDLTPWLTDIESDQADVVLNNGIYIQSTARISAYYEVAPENNTDIFVLKGTNALGLDFFISAQNAWRNSNGTKYYNAFATASIVATEDNTKVIINPVNDVVGHNANVPYSIYLDKGETYTLRALGQDPNDRFGGTTISSDKPVAVTISDDSAHNNNYGGCMDVIGDQTIPIDQLGTEYILVKGFLGKTGNLNDKVYVMAVEDNTTVEVDGGASTFTLNSGQAREVSLGNASVHLLADKDVYVMHVTGFGCEVGMAVVPSISCTGSEEVSFQRSKKGNFYVVVYVMKGGEGNFEINGDPTLLQAGDFNPVAGTNGKWLSARKKFNDNEIQFDETYRVANGSEKFHLGIINGGSDTGCLYGYYTDFGSVQTGPIYTF